MPETKNLRANLHNLCAFRQQATRTIRIVAHRWLPQDTRIHSSAPVTGLRIVGRNHVVLHDAPSILKIAVHGLVTREVAALNGM